MTFKYNGTNINKAQISGPIGYTAVGTPIINQGILLNIDSSNYIKVSNFNATSKFLIITKYKVAADGTLTYFIGNTDGFKFYITSTNANNLGCIIKGTSDSQWTNLNVPTISHQADTWYTLEFAYNGTNTYTITVKNNSGTSLGSATTTSSIKIAAGDVCFGYNGGNPASAIDLNNSFIYINDKIWFWQPSEASYVMQNGGQTGYTIAGSPSITNGVVSGFSSDDYVRTSINFELPETTKTYEIGTKVSLVDTSYRGICGSSWNFGTYGFSTADGKLRFRIRYAGGGIIASINALSNTTYYAKGKIDVDNKKASISISTDNFTWQTNEIDLPGDYTIDTNNYLFLFGKTQDGTFNGSIDLNNTYIKVNGNYFFNGASKLLWADPNIYAEGPNTYEVVGNPSIIDNVASGFSSSNYLRTSSNLSISSDEIFSAFTTGNDVSTSQVMFSCGTSNNNRTLACTIETGGYFGYGYSENGTAWTGGYNTTDHLMLANTKYNVSYSFSSSTLTVKIKKDTDISWTEFSKQLDNSLHDSNTFIKYGNDIVANKPFLGSVDLNNTYIKIDGDTWFYGKNYATQNIAFVPANYSYGSVTTTSIGYVDIPTQQFNALPNDITLGNDSITQFKQLTINAPTGATVLINGNNVSSITLPEDSAYTYSISKSGYETYTGSGVLNDDTTITLYSVSGTGATFNFNNSGHGNIFASYGEEVEYTMTSTGFVPYTGTKTISGNTTITAAQLTTSISPTPDSITINGVSANSALFEDGVSFNYTILATKTGYQNLTLTGSLTSSSNIIGTMTMITYTLTINAPTGATVMLNDQQRSSITLQAGSVYDWTVNRTNYLGEAGSGYLNSDMTIDIAELDTNITPTPDILYINGYEVQGAYFIEGNQYSYSLTAIKTGYDNFYDYGSITTSHTVSGTMSVKMVTLTINAPSGSTVSINGTNTNTVTMSYGSSYTYSISRTNYISRTGSGTLTSDTTITIAQLTTNITPTPDTITINGTSAIGAYFLQGTSYNYTIVANKTYYDTLTLTGSISTSTTVTGTMPITYPSYSKSNVIDERQTTDLYTVTINDATAGNYNITLKGANGNTGSTSFTSIKYYCGSGRGGVATCNVELKSGAIVKFVQIGTEKDSLQHSGSFKGRPYGGVGMALLINGEVKLVAGGAGQGYIEEYVSIGYNARGEEAGGGGYGGGNGYIKGYNYDGTLGNSTTHTSGTAYGGHGGFGTSSSGTSAKGGDGYIASNFTVNSSTTYYKVNSLTCTGGSDWNNGTSGNNTGASVDFQRA